jgi:hypothetical protein
MARRREKNALNYAKQEQVIITITIRKIKLFSLKLA